MDGRSQEMYEENEESGKSNDAAVETSVQERQQRRFNKISEWKVPEGGM